MFCPPFLHYIQSSLLYALSFAVQAVVVAFNLTADTEQYLI